MTVTRSQALESHYSALEARFSILDNPKYAKLVVPDGNHLAPVHRWFHLKEAFSSLLLDHVLRETGLARRPRLRILDPYAGVGTTAASVADSVVLRDLRAPTVYGLESNAFLHLVASTKLQALRHPSRTFAKFSQGILDEVIKSREQAPEAPSLSTFQRSDFFERSDLNQLMRLRQAISNYEARGADPLDVALARVSLGAIVEPVSNLRRDGRALRYTEKRTRPPTLDAFRTKAAQIVADMPDFKIPMSGDVLLGDGRSLDRINQRFQSFDLAMFSPPYPNNIDYTEVYKLENWLLGFIRDDAEFARQRLRTVYSHPSMLRDLPLPDDRLSQSENDAVGAVVAPLLDAVPSDRYETGRQRMIAGYALDMYLTLRNLRHRINESAKIVYVVGNSVHGRHPDEFVIAADLIIACLAEISGYRADAVVVARHLRRRSIDGRFLRESVVFLSA